MKRPRTRANVPKLSLRTSDRVTGVAIRISRLQPLPSSASRGIGGRHRPPCGTRKNVRAFACSIFPTAAVIASSLFLPPAARSRNSALRYPEKCSRVRLLHFSDRCGNCGIAFERLAANAVGGPASQRPANGAAAEIPVTLLLPLAARNRNPATGSAKPQFPRRGRQERVHVRPAP